MSEHAERAAGERLRVLFIGGTGTISASSVRLAVERGMEVTVLNRGRNSAGRSLPQAIESVVADVQDRASLEAALRARSWDSVVNFLSYDAANVRSMAEVFSGRTGQYVHISSASIYSKPAWRFPITESSPVGPNPPLPYATAKFEAETALWDLWHRDRFPMTIVRPSHTYDEASPPLPGSWTIIDRMKRGLQIPVHGDGTSLWTVTHASDFAQGLVGLLGNARAIGDVFHITSDDVYAWDTIYETFGRALGAEPRLVHIASEMFPLAAPDWYWSGGIVGDIAHSAIFDNSKIRSVVPSYRPSVSLHVGALEAVRWADANPERSAPDPGTETVLETLCEGYRIAESSFRALGDRAG